MKKLLIGVIVVALCLAFTAPIYAAPGGGGGFDEFGYNYNARLFNGWYGSYDKDIEGGPIPGTGDALLLMKWSKNWDPMTDQPIGAWCTNHFTWYSNDYEEGTLFGWDTRLPWTDKDSVPEAEYRVEEFAKIMKVGDNEEEWERYEEGGAYSAGWGTYESGVPKYVVFQDVVEVYDGDENLVATFNLATTSPKGLGEPIF